MYSNSSKSMYLLDLKMLQEIMYPRGSSGGTMKCVLTKDFDILLTKKKLLFAADWVIDQVTGKTDLDLCLSWLHWFDAQLHPCSNFFGSLGLENLLRKELAHPIWTCIFQCRHELSHQSGDVDLQSLPILALESVDLLASLSISSAKLLFNAINSVGLFRRSLWQWNAEVSEHLTDKYIKSLVKSLRKLEEVLNVIVESVSFEFLHQTYADLFGRAHLILEYHSVIRIRNSASSLACFDEDCAETERTFPRSRR